MVLFRYDVCFLDNHLHNSPSFSSCVSIHHHCLAQNGLISPLGHIGYDCYELPAYIYTLKWNKCNFDIQFWKQCCSVMHDWRNFSNVSFESTIIILYDNSMTIVIHPHILVTAYLCLGFCFSGTHCRINENMGLHFCFIFLNWKIMKANTLQVHIMYTILLMSQAICSRGIWLFWSTWKWLLLYPNKTWRVKESIYYLEFAWFPPWKMFPVNFW